MTPKPEPCSERPAGVTHLLGRIRAGDGSAVDQLLPLVYDELRAMARGVFGDRRGHTLQPTALVHEAYLKLAENLEGLEGRRHFLVVAGKAMRQVVADHARGLGAAKRGGGRRAVTLDTDLTGEAGSAIDLVQLHESLERLAALNERHARVVELRIFSGFSVEETAEVLGVSARSVKSDWAMAKAWLRKELRADG